MGYTHPEELKILESIFDDMASSNEEFSSHITQYYNYFCHWGGYEPLLLPPRLEDVYVAFCRDKKHMLHSLPHTSRTPDHFKMAGVLVYWLRRFAPVSGFHDLSTVNRSKDLMELLKKYPSELPAFDFGLRICHHFESTKAVNPSGEPAVAAHNFDFYKTVCYMMKFKNMSPHSLGVIYKALYVPILPLQTQ